MAEESAEEVYHATGELCYNGGDGFEYDAATSYLEFPFCVPLNPVEHDPYDIVHTLEAIKARGRQLEAEIGEAARARGTFVPWLTKVPRVEPQVLQGKWETLADDVLNFDLTLFDSSSECDDCDQRDSLDDDDVVFFD